MLLMQNKVILQEPGENKNTSISETKKAIAGAFYGQCLFLLLGKEVTNKVCSKN